MAQIFSDLIEDKVCQLRDKHWFVNYSSAPVKGHEDSEDTEMQSKGDHSEVTDFLNSTIRSEDDLLARVKLFNKQ